MQESAEPLSTGRPARRRIYHIEDLTKTYGTGPAAVHALRGVNLDVDEGEMFVLLGPSGSGKSTFLNILGGLDRATSGHAHFFDTNLTDLDDDGLTEYRRESVGFVFQFYNLIASLTAHENVSLITQISKDPMDPAEALAMVGLKERIKHFPSQLSGGEQQRVAIARAIAKRPRVMFCDEPTGALDSETGVRVLDALDRINREIGTTVFIITHNAVVAEMADDVVLFGDGRIVGRRSNATRKPPLELRW
ncbi:ABC transporter ATP-binding protein [Sphingomonas edaphi]|uniref:ABC transporter ATP-binding protein n=1 Tax=Sphingomonas edaphi TaxID=2315689 RepID=UPI001F185DF3|nr:ABC transporter ATP-binding protein [Sphingomonas edaphi]